MRGAMKTYTICGSMRFAEEMQAIAYRLETERGFNVLQCVYCGEDVAPDEEALLRLKQAHRRKIELSDGIYVVNLQGYIGASVAEEIELARRMNKEIIYHC